MATDRYCKGNVIKYKLFLMFCHLYRYLRYLPTYLTRYLLKCKLEVGRYQID